MDKKWSQKGIKSTLVADDELMIIDSADPNPATTNKRVKLSTALNAVNNAFEFQTVGATNQQIAFLFNGAASMIMVVAASNAGSTKGLSASVVSALTVTTAGNIISVSPVVTDFATAGISAVATANDITITFDGEAGETINWKGIVYIVKI